MEQWQFNACVEGYGDRCTDNAVVAVLTGYWSAYYNNTKRAKSPGKIIEKLLKEDKGTVARPDVDVEKFLAIEEQFQKKLAQGKGEQNE